VLPEMKAAMHHDARIVTDAANIYRNMIEHF
jgi:hypothetical protein